MFIIKVLLLVPRLRFDRKIKLLHQNLVKSVDVQARLVELQPQSIGPTESGRKLGDVEGSRIFVLVHRRRPRNKIDHEGRRRGREVRRDQKNRFLGID